MATTTSTAETMDNPYVNRDVVDHLLTIEDREALLVRMQAMDPDGLYTDAERVTWGIEPLDLPTASGLVTRWA